VISVHVTPASWSTVDVRSQIIEPKTIHCCVCSVVVKCDAVMSDTLLHGVRAAGVTFFQFFPPSVVAMYEPVVGANPDDVHILERRRNCIDHATMLSLFRIQRCKNPEARGTSYVSRVRSGLMMSHPLPQCRLEQHVRTRIQYARSTGWKTGSASCARSDTSRF
jgi:hypothetical protein